MMISLSRDTQHFLSRFASVAGMGRKLKCECGTCNVCRARERQRAIRRDPVALEAERARDRARYRQAPEARQAMMRGYQATDAGRQSHAKAARKWVEANPEKRRAQVAVGNALRRGKLVKGPCVFAAEGGCKGRIEAHHEDYTRPLEVAWVCSGHHARLRMRYPEEVAGGPERGACAGA
jgi:hypothetical protein